ncbi:MAG TPA: tetratricopeptide repeat protein, partial [Bacteroidota bacterium]|nr:tetratricopeptide repeat protein [Bacteroidota bacterium]
EKIPTGLFTSAILWQSAQLKEQLKMYTEASADLNKIITAYQYSAEYDLAMAEYPNALISAGNFSGAISFTRRAITLQSGSVYQNLSDPELLYLLAVANDKNGNAAEAKRYYIQYLHSDIEGAHAAESFYALGLSSKNDGKSDVATSYFKEAAEHGGKSGASEEIASMLFDNEQYEEAAKQYLQLETSTTDSKHKEQYLRDAIVATIRSDKLASGQKLIQRYELEYKPTLDAHPELRAEFAYESALFYYRQQEYTKATAALKAVNDDYSSTIYAPRARFYQGKILEVTNNLQDAAQLYLDLLDKSSNSDIIPRVLLSLGNMHFNAERYEDAIKYYQMAIDKSDSTSDIMPSAMSNLIQAYESTKLYDAALKVTKQYVAKFPTDENLIDKKIEIGLLYTKLGYYDQAVLHFQNLINESGSLLEAELRYNIGDAYFQKSDYQSAILEFLKVPYLVSRQGKVNWTATSLYMAGQSYEKMSKFDSAVEMYQQIVDRTGIDATFKSAAKKEIERVKTITK